jgi:RimJ/RimL family protein N-acetyltransferase
MNLQELKIPRPITVEEFLALPAETKRNLWDKAWRAKQDGSLNDDQVCPETDETDGSHRRRNIVRPEDVGYYMSDEEEDNSSSDKGKMREPCVVTPWANPHPNDPIQASVNDDLINWPEDIQSENGPPSSDDDFHSVSTDNMSDSPATFSIDPIDQFMFPLGRPPVDPNLGREYFEPDIERSRQLKPIPEDPKAKEILREAVHRKVDELRAQTVHQYQKTEARLARRRILKERSEANAQAGAVPKTAPKMLTTFGAKPIGLVYLTSSQNFSDPLHKGECNIGFYVAPEYRTLTRLSATLHKAIEDAFRDQDCHRLQAVLVDHPDILDFLNLYASV